MIPLMAERVGFEPTCGECPQTDFESFELLFTAVFLSAFSVRLVPPKFLAPQGFFQPDTLNFLCLSASARMSPKSRFWRELWRELRELWRELRREQADFLMLNSSSQAHLSLYLTTRAYIIFPKKSTEKSGTKRYTDRSVPTN